MSSKTRVRNLLVYTDEVGKSYIQLSPDSTRFKVVEAIIDMALSILETPKGRQSLVDVATRFVVARNSAKNPVPHLYKRPMNEMPKCIDEFLDKTRKNFPYTFLTITDGEAIAVKEDWGTDMAQYDP
ncbi:hypothetical protein QBC33DRAFT_561242 [Phialemonium atrogriseum]|uniref:Uncharacterized protein n=1 Tax=Phialemonium atrogriseum TaxID=1093897 RepID=A0AAJ0BXM3_9PEZI|nr:uncharacterized protein QBC33DRAFT_561242 [Phialemonium atrogriseum]KAK1764962.1 hypothetical protein QBC33DRAFT_561242 [Phialemonium atrogriseum]